MTEYRNNRVQANQDRMEYKTSVNILVYGTGSSLLNKMKMQEEKD